MQSAADVVRVRPVREALRLSDPLGVLSVYVAAREAALPGSAAVHGLKVELRRLHETVGATRVAPAERLVDDLLLSGARNLALFTALGSGASVAVEPAGAVPTRVTVGVRADVRPLCLALQEARPAGVALVDADSVRALEWRPGELSELWSERMPELESRELLGPARAHPRGDAVDTLGFRAAQQRDLYERRMADERARFVAASCAPLVALATERGWSELALSGDNKLVDVLEAGVTGTASLEIVVVPRLERWRSAGQLATLVAPWIEGGRTKQAERLLWQLAEEAKPAGLAAIGPGETLAALSEGRVRVLVLDAGADITGRSTPDGVLAAAGEVPPGVPESMLVEDAQLADAMVARALDTAAEVVVVPARVAKGTLLDVAGAAALTRW